MLEIFDKIRTIFFSTSTLGVCKLIRIHIIPVSYRKGDSDVYNKKGWLNLVQNKFSEPNSAKFKNLTLKKENGVCSLPLRLRQSNQQKKFKNYRHKMKMETSIRRAFPSIFSYYYLVDLL